MIYQFQPKGVCSHQMIIEIEDDVIKKIEIIGGCAGNTVGISQLLVGMNAEEAIKRMKGIPCGRKETSCPDQLAKGIEQALEQQRKQKEKE